MDSNEIFAALVTQAVEQGASPITIRALVEEASEMGVTRALQRLGLDDTHAAGDISELRELLISWRDIRTTARRTTVSWITKLLLTLIVIALAVYGRKTLNL